MPIGEVCGARCERPHHRLVREAMFLLRAGLQSQGGLGHLALAKLGKVHLIHREFPAIGANDGLAEGRAHCTFVNPDLADIAVEFPAAFLALEVDRHRTVSVPLVR